MNILTVPVAVLRLQYKIVRIPLQLVEDQLISRLATESPARLRYERTLGVLDGAVGIALGDSDTERRGNALTERSDALARAVELEQHAARTEAAADTELETKRTEVHEQQVAAIEAKQRDVEQARHREDERKQAAERDAEQRKQAAKKQADQLAAQRTRVVEAEYRAEQIKIWEAEQKAAAPAKAQLKEAADRQDEAADKRARADHVEKLAEAEKSKRSTETTANGKP
ncbi:IF2 family translation initiation factor [Rhodococcus opacus]|uniref:IF2 family translation initiation factor n=1 Tax=Rhodococcus opacus TaxID=37919 RepID=A0A2S8IEC5_RHOOP|nr:IF2 family translation initiation factor [Rhodococcus opacus]PQP13143.1 IF2 family translation initiation factor [Rhodococcus opacus]